METIAQRIVKSMRLNGMKQSDLVEKTGIGKSSISTYISGAYEPKQRNIYKLAKVLNVSEAWLMGNDVPMERKEMIYNSELINKSALIKKESFQFSDLEKQIIEKYRDADDFDKTTILRTLRIVEKGEIEKMA